MAQGMEYIHSEGVVHGDLRGVRYLKHVAEMLTFLFRRTSSWMLIFTFKSQISD